MKATNPRSGRRTERDVAEAATPDRRTAIDPQERSVQSRERFAGARAAVRECRRDDRDRPPILIRPQGQGGGDEVLPPDRDDRRRARRRFRSSR